MDKVLEKIKQIAEGTTMTEAEVAGTLHSQVEKGLPLNLQFFAEPNDPPEEPPADPPEDDPKDEDTFTKSQVDSQISKAVDSALKKQQAKLEKEKQVELDKAKAEAADYAKMTQKEKEDAEYQKRVKALEDRERELNNRQLLSEIESDLKENELPGAFAESLLSLQDNEKIKEQITNLKSAFDEAVNTQVKEALRQDTPKTGGGIQTQSKVPSIAEMAAKARVIKN